MRDACRLGHASARLHAFYQLARFSRSTSRVLAWASRAVVIYCRAYSETSLHDSSTPALLMACDDNGERARYNDTPARYLLMVGLPILPTASLMTERRL